MAGKAPQPGADPLEQALTELNRKFGNGTVIELGSAEHQAVEAIPTGSLGLDHALGIDGIPRGRVTEIYGPESSGKTTLTLNIVANAQAAGGKAAFIDAEHALDPEYAANIGVDTGKLLVNQPDSGEQALEVTERLVRSGGLAVVVIDSVAALTPQAEIDGEMGASHVGLQARLMSQALRKLVAVSHDTNTAVIFINQLREKIGVMFGSPETTTGGKALKFYASIRLDIRKIETLKSGDVLYGNRVKVKVVKNKCAAPFRSAEFDIRFGHGVDRESELLDLGVLYGAVRKLGAWYDTDLTGTPYRPAPGSDNVCKLGQGKEKSAAYLRQHPDVAEVIAERVRAKLAEGTLAGQSHVAVPAMPPAGAGVTMAGRAASAEPELGLVPDSGT